MTGRFLRKLAVKTNFWPMREFYRMCYSLVASFIARELQKLDGVVSIYLIASMAAGDSVYGLSDIDFVIITKDGTESKWRAVRRYEELSRFIPMISADEMAIFSVDEVLRSYKESNLHLKYKLFTECKKQGKLLYGDDILKEFNLLDNIQRNEFILGQLAFIWSIFLKNFLIDDKDLGRLMESYICYKLTSDACKALISVRTRQELFNRRDALALAAPHLEEKQKKHIRKMQVLARKRFTGAASRIRSDTFDFCIDAIQNSIEQMPRMNEDDADKGVGAQARFDFENLDIIVSDSNKRSIQDLVALCGSVYKEYVRSVLISPFDLLHMEEKHLCAFLIPGQPLPYEAVREFNRIAGNHPHAQRLHLYVAHPDAAISLNTFREGEMHSVLFPLQWMQTTALYLSSPFSSRYGEPLKYHKSRRLIKNYFLHNLRESVAEDEIVIRKLMDDPNIFRLSPLEFHLFVWQALRLKLVEVSEPGKFFIPLTSRQVYRQCRNSQNMNLPWLDGFHREYIKDLNGTPSDSEAYFPEALAALKKIYASGANA